MVCAVEAARADEVYALTEQHLERSRGNALGAFRHAISDALVDAVECRQRLEAAERASRGFMRQLPPSASEVKPGGLSPSGASLPPGRGCDR